MKDLFERFIEGLCLPENVRESLDKPRTNEEMKNYAISLPQLLYPDTYILSGRLLIYLNIKSCPKKVKDYVDILQKILREEIKDFFLTHQNELDKLLEETYYYNFKDHNIMSASSCVNYLLRLTHDECSMETPCQMFMRLAIQFYHDEGLEKVTYCYHQMIQLNLHL